MSGCCPICNYPSTQTILALDGMPLFSNVLHDTRAKALEAERAAMQLDFCVQCGFVFNALFDPDRMRYRHGYENDLSVSPRFREYATHLAAELVQRHRLENSDIIEIGCGNGYFLQLLCDMGKSRGVGFDPSYTPARAPAGGNESRIRIVDDVYSPQYGHCAADMICCRQVLEHIHDPLGFLCNLRGTLDPQDDYILFFEVPNAEHTFLHGAVWDILYEHCNYFTAQSLEALFAAAGFQPLRIDARYDDQFLTIEARPDSCPEGHWHSAADGYASTAKRLADFEGRFREIVASWRSQVASWQQQHRQVVIWGSGTKGATFLNVLRVQPDVLEFVVDIHPRKQGQFIPGTGQEIIPPASLARYRPDTIIVMNPAYLQEVRDMAGAYTTRGTFVTASPLNALYR